MLHEVCIMHIIMWLKIIPTVYWEVEMVQKPKIIVEKYCYCEIYIALFVITRYFFYTTINFNLIVQYIYIKIY